MMGQFIFASCHSIGFGVRALLRNTGREGVSVSAGGRGAPIAIDLCIYREGELLASYPRFGEIATDELLEISATTCPELGTSGEHLVVARCSIGSGNEYFAQEHQLIYERSASNTFATLLYDQMPLPRQGSSAPPIVLLAPKAWVSTELACSVVFATAAVDGHRGYQDQPLEIAVLNEQGGVIAHEERAVREHDVLIFDVRDAVAGRVPLGRSPSFFDVVARGGAGSFAILTILVNETTGACAVEHSLSPHYYASRLERLRSEALRLPALASGRRPS
jgi:hypothetical protein